MNKPMKWCRIIKMAIPVILGFFLIVPICLFGEWGPDVRISNDDSYSWVSFSNAWCVGTNGSNIHVVWWDIRDGNHEIYYKRSTNGGANWGPETRLTYNDYGSTHPCIAVLDSFVHLVWMDNRDSHGDIYYKRSTNNGTTWGSDTKLTVQSSDADKAYYPSLTVIDSFAHVVWYNNTGGNCDIYYKRSTNRGANWGSSTRLTTNASTQQYSSIAVFDSFVHVVWVDYRDRDYEIYYKRSTNRGVNWGSDTRLTNSHGISNSTCVAISDSFVHVVWQDTRDNWPETEIYYKKSTNNGSNWGSDTRLTNDADYYSSHPSVAVSNSNVHVVWHDTRPGNMEIYYKNSANSGVTWGSDTRITNNNAMSISPCVSVTGTIVHVVWNDNRDENWEVYYKNNSDADKTEDNRKSYANKSSKTNPQIVDNNGNSFFTKLHVYNNPIREHAIIEYSIPASRYIRLRLFDISGRIINTLFKGKRPSGTHIIRWSAHDDLGKLLAPGIYSLVLEMDEKITTEKILIVR